MVLRKTKEVIIASLFSSIVYFVFVLLRLQYFLRFLCFKSVFLSLPVASSPDKRARGIADFKEHPSAAI